jgi:hypothetical protein
MLASDDKQAVFVDYVELVKNPDIGLFRNVVSLVWLTHLDFCERGSANEWGDETPYSFIKPAFPILGKTNGEHGLLSSIDGSRTKNGELVDQMIKSRPQIVNAVSNDEGESGIDDSNFIERDKELFLPFKVRIRDNWLDLRFRAQGGLERRIDLIEVCLRTLNFGAN